MYNKGHGAEPSPKIPKIGCVSVAAPTDFSNRWMTNHTVPVSAAVKSPNIKFWQLATGNMLVPAADDAVEYIETAKLFATGEAMNRQPTVVSLSMVPRDSELGLALAGLINTPPSLQRGDCGAVDPSPQSGNNSTPAATTTSKPHRARNRMGKRQTI